MKYGLEVLELPTAEPLSLADYRLHLRVDETYEDSMILAYARAAREYVESYTATVLLRTRFRLTLDRFPRGCFDPCRSWGNPSEDGSIEIPRWPLCLEDEEDDAIVVEYTDAAGDAQTLDAANYVLDARSRPPRITLAPGRTWPVLARQPGSVQVTFSAGHTSAAQVPDAVKTAMRLLVGHWYKNREAVADVMKSPLPLAVSAMLDTASVRGYA